MALQIPEDIMAMADSRVQAAQHLRGDLLDVLFPRAGTPPSEMLQVEVKLVLQQLVLSIEQRLVGDDRRRPESWETLSFSALLREPELIDFALARLAERRLRARLAKAGTAAQLAQLPARLLGHEQPRLAELGRALLQAEQKHLDGHSILHERLPPEALHQLCWRIVAALHPEGASEPLLSAAKTLLEGRSADHNPLALAEKLLFFLGPEYRDELASPSKVGLSLFVAGLARDAGLECDRILQLIDDEEDAPLLLLLRACGLTPAGVESTIITLRERAESGVADRFAAIDPVEARAMIAKWQETPMP